MSFSSVARKPEFRINKMFRRDHPYSWTTPPPYKTQFMFLYVYRFISSIRSWLDVKYIKILLFIIKFQYDLVSKNLLELQNSKKGHLQLISLNLELKRNLFGKIFLKPSIKSINKKTLQILTYNKIKICQKKSHYNLT